VANAGATCKTAIKIHARENNALDVGFIVRHMPRLIGRSMSVRILKRFLHDLGNVESLRDLASQLERNS
jgi:hypothetical protein